MMWLLQSVIFLSVWIGTVHGCVDNYFDFEEQTFGNNSENRLKLNQVFYPTNTHLPYSVVVTYQAVFPNGTQVNISTDPNCPYRQVWIWLSSPVFLYEEPSSLNRHTLFTLNYFEEWIPSHVIITVPYPCQDQAEGLMQQMTSSLQSYTLAGNAGVRFKGNVARACGENSYIFISDELSIVAGMGLILLGLFVLSAIPVIFQRNQDLLPLAHDTNDYSFKSFGLFWGVSATLFFCAIGISISDLWFLIKVFHDLGTSMQVVWVLCIVLLSLLTTAAALFIALTSTFTVPHFYSFLAKVCCCYCCYNGRELPAHTLVTFLALLFDMLGLQLLCHHGVVAILAIPAAPVTIVTNVLLIVLVGTCAIYTFAFVFTMCAKLTNLCCPRVQDVRNENPLIEISEEDPTNPPANPDEINDDDYTYLVRAGILIPFLMAIAFLSALLAFSGKYVNSATEQDNFPSFLLSIFIPLLLTGIIIGLKWLIKKWLRTEDSPKEPATETQQEPATETQP